MRRIVLALVSILATAGCDEMKDQARLDAYEDTELFQDGKVNQQPVPGTVARGEIEFHRQLEVRPAMSVALIERGQERYNIFCAPCHSLTGDGDGMIVQRGFPRPPSLVAGRASELPPERTVEVITDGYGVMFSYAARVSPPDRWAIAAYIQALQLSQGVNAAELPEDLRQRLADEAS